MLPSAAQPACADAADAAAPPRNVVDAGLASDSSSASGSRAPAQLHWSRAAAVKIYTISPPPK